MDGWLSPGIEPAPAERWPLLPAMTRCVLTTSTGDGALHARTALIEHADASGSMFTVRLPNCDVRQEVIANPRVTLTAWPASGGMALVVITGLATARSRPGLALEREALLLDIAIVRMEHWGTPGNGIVHSRQAALLPSSPVLSPT